MLPGSQPDRQDSINLSFRSSRIELTHLSWREYGDVVLVDDARLLLDELGAALLLEVLAGQPEEDVLLAVLAAEECAEDLPTLWKGRTGYRLLRTVRF